MSETMISDIEKRLDHAHIGTLVSDVVAQQAEDIACLLQIIRQKDVELAALKECPPMKLYLGPNGHVYRATLPGEPRHEGGVCVRCGDWATAGGQKPCLGAAARATLPATNADWATPVGKAARGAASAVTLRNCHTKVREEPVTSGDNRTVKYSRITIDVTGWITQNDIASKRCPASRRHCVELYDIETVEGRVPQTVTVVLPEALLSADDARAARAMTGDTELPAPQDCDQDERPDCGDQDERPLFSGIDCCPADREAACPEKQGAPDCFCPLGHHGVHLASCAWKRWKDGGGSTNQ